MKVLRKESNRANSNLEDSDREKHPKNRKKNVSESLHDENLRMMMEIYGANVVKRWKTNY